MKISCAELRKMTVWCLNQEQPSLSDEKPQNASNAHSVSEVVPVFRTVKLKMTLSPAWSTAVALTRDAEASAMKSTTEVAKVYTKDVTGSACRVKLPLVILILAHGN